MDVQAEINPLDVLEASRQELPPKSQVLFIAGVEPGGLGEHGGGDVRPPRLDRPVGQLPDRAIEPGQLLDRTPPIGLPVQEMLVAVEDRAELRAPVADVIVADRIMAGELQHAAQGVADDRRADVPDVHRLGDVRGGIIDDEPPRPRRRGDAQAPVAQRRGQPLDEPAVANPQVDEPGAGNLRRSAEVGDVQALEQFGGDLARGPAKPLAQRHRQIRLVVAELRVLAAANHLQQVVRGAAVLGQGAAEAFLQFGQNAHRRKIRDGEKGRKGVYRGRASPILPPFVLCALASLRESLLSRPSQGGSSPAAHSALIFAAASHSTRPACAKGPPGRSTPASAARRGG